MISSLPNSIDCCVIGLGYIGLPTAAIVADNGIRTRGFDVNHNVVDVINQGDIHIVEKELKNLVSIVVNNGMLSAHSEIQKSDVLLSRYLHLYKKDNHAKPNLKYVKEAAYQISKVYQPGNLIVLESTSGRDNKVFAELFHLLWTFTK